MPIYQMSGEGDSNNLDYVTRERMRMEYHTDNYFLMLIGIGLFVLGIIVGSTIHDAMFHVLER